MKKQIENDDQYEKARIAVLELAEYLDNPDPLDEAVEKKQLIYDRTTDLMLLYSRGHNVKEYPAYYKPKYDRAGWAYQE
ncbi:hypothetical protein [Paenibacillus sp. Marseille-Q4541]|uniref:hypothetical protein n=1 Tax=Paenibacillus sp. Marseille-Q4541 TaxID=2831522 RepID=UPI001BABE04B|nr:hypothetical protein [Paenibacillus sp. Marseille-Q4541]